MGSTSDKIQYLVREFCFEQEVADGIAYVAEIDSFAEWQEGKNYWKILTEDQMRRRCFEWLMDNTEREIRTSFVADFVKIARWMVRKQLDRINTPYISFKDKILDTTDFSFKRPRPNIPSFICQEYEFKETNSPTPVWDKFLHEIMVDKGGNHDPDLMEYLYQVLGYMLVPEMANQTMFYFVGAGANGKSTLLNLLVDIVGKEFVSAESIEALTTKDFILPNLIGKRLNIVNEEQSRYVQAERFKALVSGDPVSARRIYGEPFTFVPTSKFIFASNHIPQFNEWDGGIERRVRIIPFNYNVPEEKRDNALARKLRAEIPGIVGKILRRGTEVVIQNKFKIIAPLQVMEMTTEFKRNTATIEMFIKSAFEPSGNESHFRPHSEIYHIYKMWAAQTGRKAVTSRNFFKKFAEVYPDCESDVVYHDGQAQRGRYVRQLDGDLYDI